MSNKKALIPTKNVSTADNFSNPVARLGFGTQNLMQASVYPMVRLTQNYELLNSLYRNNWIVQNIISTIPEDVTKRWFRITSEIDPDNMDKITRLQRQTHLRNKVVEGMKWGRLYGGAGALILIEGQEDMLDIPLDLDMILPNSFKGLYILDRWSGIYPDLELISDINDPDYGLPAYYSLIDKDGAFNFKVHHSRIIRFPGRKLPYYEEINELYWGQSEIESIYEEIVKRDNVSNNMASLTFKANLDVIAMDNVDQMFAIAGTEVQRRFWERMQAQSVLRSNFGVQIMESGDEFKQFQYGFAGLDKVYDAIMMDVAGAARIPVTKLFGRSPAGLNATGESDLQNYYDYIDEKRESDFRPIVEKLLPILAISAWGKIPDDLDFTFDPVRTLSDDKVAKLAREKVLALTEAFKSGGMDQASYMKELRALGTTTGMFTNIPDDLIPSGEGVWYWDLQALNDPYVGLTLGSGGKTIEELEEEETSEENLEEKN